MSKTRDASYFISFFAVIFFTYLRKRDLCEVCMNFKSINLNNFLK